MTALIHTGVRVVAATGDEERQTRIVDGGLQVYANRRGWIDLGWAAHIIGTAAWLTPAAPVEALNVPRNIGKRTIAQLHAAGIKLPVINIPGPPDRWALLMQPHDGSVAGILALFAGHDVGYAYAGRYEGATSEWGIDVPPTQHPGHDALSWIVLPGCPLPSARAVVDALIDVLGT
jgi:hypothetical protein